MAEDNNDALDALRRHNDELAKLLSPEGIRELDRMALLESAVIGFTAVRSEHWQNLARTNLDTTFRNLELAISGQQPSDGDNHSVKDVASYIGVLRGIGGAAKNLTKKVGSVANSYVKQAAGKIMGNDED